MMIYAAYLKNELVYVGKTIRSLDKRIYDHCREAKRSGYPFHSAILKYGIDSFRFETIRVCDSLEDLNKAEIEEIANRNPRYNLMRGGNGGFEKGGSVAKKVSASLMGHKSHNKGKPMSEEQKLKIKNALLLAYKEKRRTCTLTKEARATGLKNRDQSEISKRGAAKTNSKRWGTVTKNDGIVLYKSSLIDLEA